MILDVIKNLPQYASLSKGFEKVIEFLSRQNLDSLPLGKHEIDGRRAFAIVSKNVGRRKESAQLEAHEQYIDVQVVLGGTDSMGWKSISQCEKPAADYNEERDVKFFSDVPDVWLSVKRGSFAIFFPGDAHMPSISSESIHKIIVKIAVDQINALSVQS